MIVIGGTEAPAARVKLLDETEADEAFYYAKNVTAATLPPADDPRVPNVIDWPVPQLVPQDARGWWVYGATWDPQYIDIDYSTRSIILKKVGVTSLTFTIENADGSQIDLVWPLDILDKQLPLMATLDPSFDTTMDIAAAWLVTAQVDGGDYPYTFRWYKGGTLVRTRTTVDPTDKTDRLAFASLTWDDETNYRVTVTDRRGLLSTTNQITLTITEKPITFQNSNVTRRVKQGAAFSESIDYAGGRPPFQLRWLKGGVTSTFTGDTLIIPSVQPAHVGKWTLQVDDSRQNHAVSTNGITLYCMEIALQIEALSAQAAERSTQSSPAQITTVIDMGLDVVDIQYLLSATRYDNGNSETPKLLSFTGVNNTLLTVSQPGALGLKLVPKLTGKTTFTARTNDNRSEQISVTADIIAIPRIVTQDALSVLVKSGDIYPTYTLSPTISSEIVANSYQWESKAPGDGADWQAISGATGKTLLVGAAGVASSGGTSYRLRITNQFTTRADVGIVYSDPTTRVWATFDGLQLIRSDANPDDAMIPGGIYIFDVKNPVTDAGNTTALNDAGTTSTLSLSAAIKGLGLSQSGKTQARMTVSATASAGNTNLRANISNGNGVPVSTLALTKPVTVVVPIMDRTAFDIATEGTSEVSILGLGPAFRRGSTLTASVTGNAAQYATFAFDMNTGSVKATGTNNTAGATVTGNVLVRYNAPGTAAVQSYNIPITLIVRQTNRFRAGEGTAGDKLTSYE